LAMNVVVARCAMVSRGVEWMWSKEKSSILLIAECGRLIWPRLSARMLAPPGW
jgi:hypothetical protein